MLHKLTFDSLHPLLPTRLLFFMIGMGFLWNEKLAGRLLTLFHFVVFHIFYCCGMKFVEDAMMSICTHIHCKRRTPSLGEKIQHGCLMCLGSEQPSCFRCLIILGCNFQKIRATPQNVEFHLISQYYGVRTWDVKHFSDHAAKGYVWLGDVKICFQSGSLLHGVKESSYKSNFEDTRGLALCRIWM